MLSFLIGLFVIFLLNCESSLQIRVLGQKHVLQIFSPSLGLVFHFLKYLLMRRRLYFLNFYLFIYGHCGSSLLRGSCGCSLLWWVGFSLQRLLLLGSAGSGVVAHGLTCSTACGIFPDQGSNPCVLD